MKKFKGELEMNLLLKLILIIAGISRSSCNNTTQTINYDYINLGEIMLNTPKLHLGKI